MTPSQTVRILMRLEDGPMCSFEPLRWDPPISRTAARIANLRDAGWIIDTEPCREHRHTGRAVQYTLNVAASWSIGREVTTYA